MDHVKTIKIDKLTLPQKHLFRKWAGVLDSTKKIIILYFSDVHDTSYDEIYNNLSKKNQGLVVFSRLKIAQRDLKMLNFIDIVTLPTFVFYQKRCKLAQLNGPSISPKVLQGYIDNILYHKKQLGIPEL